MQKVRFPPFGCFWSLCLLGPLGCSVYHMRTCEHANPPSHLVVVVIAVVVVVVAVAVVVVVVAVVIVVVVAVAVVVVAVVVVVVEFGTAKSYRSPLVLKRPKTD